MVTGRPGTSESESQVNICGLRRYIRWRDLIRCLNDVADDGVVSVLCISCCQHILRNSRRNSSRLVLAGGFVEQVPGELLSADFTYKFHLRGRGEFVRNVFCFGVFNTFWVS